MKVSRRKGDPGCNNVVIHIFPSTLELRVAVVVSRIARLIKYQ